MTGKLLVLFLSVVLLVAADDTFEENSKKIALKVYNDCSVKEDFSMCLKAKAITFLDRLSRMKKFTISDSVTLVRAENAPETENSVTTEDQLEKVLPRSGDAKNEALNNMLLEKLTSYATSRSLEIAIPKNLDTARKEGGGFGLGGGGGKDDKKGGGTKAMLALLLGAKIYTVGSIALAAVFLLAKKALIVAKIALVLSAIIGLKKLLASKSGGYEVHHVSAHGGGGYGGGHGGWDKRSSEAAQNLAYNAYSPQDSYYSSS